MGFTHYWQQKKSFTKAAWLQLVDELGQIIENVKTIQGIQLEIEIENNVIYLNGAGEEGHETFCIHRDRPEKRSYQQASQRGWDFTKTDRKPYDVLVTAGLIYLSTIHPKQFPPELISSDGTGWNFLAGLDVAKQALPRYANQLDIPLGVRQDDRWTYRPELRYGIDESDYDLRACVNGKVYVFRSGIALYAFDSFTAAGQWVESNKDQLYCGHTHAGNRASVKKRQNVVFAALVRTPSAALDDIPLFVRPRGMVQAEYLNHAPAEAFELAG